MCRLEAISRRWPWPRALTGAAALRSEPRKPPIAQDLRNTSQGGPLLVEALAWVGAPRIPGFPEERVVPA